MKIVKCRVCGAEFEAKANNQKYCSPDCMRKARREGRARNARERYAREKPSASGKYVAPGEEAPLNLRKCHDCKKPTTQYRCPACQIAFRRKYEVTESILDD